LPCLGRYSGQRVHKKNQKYGGHMGKNVEPIYDLGHMGISLELNSGKIMADIWELPRLHGQNSKTSFLKKSNFLSKIKNFNKF
jgi:hypothetical protein